MAAATYYNQVQEIYVAYYGRPADPAGLQYWAGKLDAAGGNLTTIINAFGNSTESTALYAGSSNSAIVTAIYQQLFNRAPDSAGLAFYTAALTAGTMTGASIALNVADGAQNTDATYLANKITVANAFTDALTVDSSAALAYDGTTAITAARSLISGVTTSAATTNVASTITSIKAGGGGSTAGETFTLTTTAEGDDLTGTNYDDIFIGRSATINSDGANNEDQINGGGGNDVFEVTINTAADLEPIEVNSVEQINVTYRIFDTDNTVPISAFDAENVSGANITVSSPNGFSERAKVINALDNTLTVGSNISELVIDGYDEGLITAGDGVSLVIINSEGDTVNLNASGTVTMAVESTAGEATGATDTNVNVTGADGSEVVWLYDGEIEELTIGAGVTFLANADSFAADHVVTGAGTLGISGGTFSLVDVEVDVTAVANVEGDAEATTFEDADGKTITVDVDAEDGADVTIDTTTGEGGSFTVNLMSDLATLDLGAANAESSTVVVDAGVSTIESLVSAADLNLTINAGADVAFVDDAGDATSLDAEDNAVTVNGAGSLTLDFSGSSFDGSDATGAIELNLTYADGAAVTTGSGADIIHLGAEAGAGGSDNGVVVDTGDGNDTINFADAEDDAVADTSVYVDAGEGSDLFVLGTADWAITDSADLAYLVINGGEGSDTARLTLGAAAAVDFTSLDAFVINGIETINIVGGAVTGTGTSAADFVAEADVTFGASQLDGVSTSITGNLTSNNQVVAVVTDAEDSELDMSDITIDSKIETVVVDLSVASADDALTVTLTGRKEYVIGAGDVAGFSINLGSGDDEYTIGAVGGELTLGAGDDAVVFNGEGVIVDANLDATGIVAIDDFSLTADSITAVGLDVGGESNGTVDANTADAEGGDVYATGADGIITLSGTDKANIDTIEEWVDVVGLLTAEGDIWAFEFEDSTYVMTSDGTDAVKLVGVTGIEDISEIAINT